VLEQTLYYPGRTLVRIYTKIMLRMSIHGRRKLPRGPKIFVANHPTTSDPFFLLATIRERTNILIKNTLFKVPVFGKYLKLSGYIPVVEGQGHTALTKAKEFLDRGISVIVFIEGSTSPDKGGFHKPKTGAVRLALSTGAPILPIGIGVHKKNIKFIHSEVRGKKELGRWYFRGPYALTFGKCHKLTGDINNRNKVRLFSQQIMQQIRLLANQSSTRLALLQT
jgi:1-acyl-sn-glycerol-3-phosphate acyltransferase